MKSTSPSIKSKPYLTLFISPNGAQDQEYYRRQADALDSATLWTQKAEGNSADVIDRRKAGGGFLLARYTSRTFTDIPVFFIHKGRNILGSEEVFVDVIRRNAEGKYRNYSEFENQELAGFGFHGSRYHFMGYQCVTVSAASRAAAMGRVLSRIANGLQRQYKADSWNDTGYAEDVRRVARILGINHFIVEEGATSSGRYGFHSYDDSTYRVMTGEEAAVLIDSMVAEILKGQGE